MDNRPLKIALINQSSGPLIVDDLNAYCTKYAEVAILCPGLILGVRNVNNKVKVDHVCKYDRSSSIKRLLTWFACSIQVFFKLLFKYRGWEVVYYTNPPMACFCGLLLKNKFRLVEYDIYPDALKTIGIKESNIIYKLWGKLKHKLYKKADMVYTLSEGMKEILTKYGSADKIKVVPLWSTSDEFKPLEKKDNPFIKDYDLDGKFVVMYSGNIGYTHSVEVLVEVAKQMNEDPDVLFLIIGEGKKKKELQDDVARSGLNNVRFMSYVDFNILPYSLASADLGVITLDENVSKVSVPSKTFNLMAVGAPILAISNEDTEMYRLLNKYNNGKCISKNDTNGIVGYIRELKTNSELKSMYSKNSIVASRDFTYKNAELYL